MRKRTLILSAVVVALAVFVLVPTGQASASYGMTHCVMPGQTLYSIAMMHGTSVWAIAHANGIVNPNYIRAGRCLVIPGYAPHPWPHPMPHPMPAGCWAGGYVVMPGDTLFSIGVRFGVSPWAIAQRNGIANPNYIRAGQCLRIW